jgi:protocatechuate 3,4-dioxygenase beta subunit
LRNVFAALFVIMAIAPASAIAQSISSGCMPTPTLNTYPYPGVARIPNGNHLGKPAGKVAEATGQILLLHGRVLDARCRPVKDAIIELWQANPFGNFVLATDADLVSASTVFTGAGRAFSNEEGRFEFVTLFPGTLKNRAPNLNIRVKVQGLKRPLQTQLFFAGDMRNDKDPVYRYVRPINRARVTLNMQPMSAAFGRDGMEADIDIVLSQNIGYLTY